jgi:hypothetical protein
MGNERPCCSQRYTIWEMKGHVVHRGATYGERKAMLFIEAGLERLIWHIYFLVLNQMNTSLTHTTVRSFIFPTCFGTAVPSSGSF